MIFNTKQDAQSAAHPLEAWKLSWTNKNSHGFNKGRVPIPNAKRAVFVEVFLLAAFVLSIAESIFKEQTKFSWKLRPRISAANCSVFATVFLWLSNCRIAIIPADNAAWSQSTDAGCCPFTLASNWRLTFHYSPRRQRGAALRCA